MDSKKTIPAIKIWLFILLVIATSIICFGRNPLWMKLNRELETVSKSFVHGDKVVQFVELKNIVITLDDNKSERYLQLELGIATGDDDDIKRVIEMLPAIRAATVNLLTHSDYQTVRQMSVADLRRELMNEYKKEFKYFNSEIPFDGVVISKMVFR